MTHIKAMHVLAVAAALLLSAPLFLHADTVSEVRIEKSGIFSGKNLTIIQKSGTNIFARATWGQAFVRIVILTNAKTAMAKNYGENASIADIKEGHIIDVEGILTSGADSLMVTASLLRDVSLTRESKEISGTVQSTDASAASFLLKNTEFGATTVALTATTTIQKGARTIGIGEMAASDKILSARGAYEYQTNTLTASRVEVFQDTAKFKPRNFEGTLKSISSATLPATLVVAVSGTEYTVYAPQNAVVLNTAKKPAELKRFAAGDTVRFYGAIRQANFAEVDAEVLRDLDF